MLRPVTVLLAVAAAVTLGPVPAQASGSAAAPAPGPTSSSADDGLALAITIDTLTPSVVPTRGPLTISGSITNTSDDQWRAINIYPLASATPITTAKDLEAAARTDPEVVVGDRFSPFVTLEVLDPGQTSAYTLRIPRAALPIADEPGVYWLGVHALGETDDGRDDPADGKARTFLPLVDPPTAQATGADGPPIGPSAELVRNPVDVALVVSIRRQVTRDADGRVADPAGWAADLAPGGRLDALTRFATAAGGRPLTWLVDPAVTDAVAQIANGNPARSLGRGGRPADDEPDPDSGAIPRAAGGATAWLNAASTALKGDRIMALPYGDIDVAGAAEHAPGMYQVARRRSGRSIAALDLPASPIVAPISGYLDDTAVGIMPPSGRALVSNQMVPSDSAVVRTLGHKLVVARTQATDGGPGPGDRKRPVDVRQRILSEAALRLLEGSGPLVVSFPHDWDPRLNPTQAVDFFNGLDVPWLRLTSLTDIGSRPATSVNALDLSYPAREQAREAPATTFDAVLRLMTAGRQLDAVLPENDRLGRQVTLEALPAASYAARADLAGATAATRSAAWIRAQLAKITITPPTSFTLLSDTGQFSATVVNGLDQPVQVRVLARTDDKRVQVESSDVLDLGPQERQSLLMEARSSLLGVHQVDLLVADAQARPIGPEAEFPLRAAQVSQAIWVVIAAGAVLLFTAIGVRLVRRIRRHRAHRPSPSGAAV